MDIALAIFTTVISLTNARSIDIKCDILSAPENGNIVGNNHSYNDSVSFSCNDGFILDGASNLTCQYDGTWSSPIPICKGACLNPLDVENARHNGSKDYYLAGEIVVYECNTGYYRGGSLPPLLVCRASEGSLDWGNFDVTCIPKSCGPPDTIANGTVEGSIYSFLNSVTYICDIGYRIEGLATRYCQSDQQWSGYTPRCIPIDDSERSTMPQDPANGRWVRGRWCQSGQYQFPGCELSYTCNEGYEPANTGVIYVASGAEWDKIEEPSCQQAKDVCPERDLSLKRCGKACTPDTGCRKAGRKCECAGECGWSCVRQGCTRLPAPENGAVEINTVDVSVGSTATFTCNDGYILQGTPHRTCQENKRWSETDEVLCIDTTVLLGCIKNNDEVNRLGQACARPCPSGDICIRRGYSCICDGICGKSCIPVEQNNYCDPALLSASHATFTIDPPTAVFGSIARYACADGFFSIGGDHQRTCTGGRSWNGSAIICYPEKACYDPPLVENARHNGSNDYYLAGELLRYTCDYGYYRGSSIPLIMCQETGDSLAWSNFEMLCLPKSCGYPGSIDHGRIEGSVFSFRSSVTYVCDIGFKMQGLATRYCQADQQWSGSFPRCIPVTCRPLSAPRNGKKYGIHYGYNDEVFFTCNNGFILDGEAAVTCQHDGTWSWSTPVCKALSDVCSMPPDLTHGQWIKGSYCRDGHYQLQGCQLSYTCDTNYIPKNTTTVYICSEPEWDHLEEPQCKPDACFHPPIVKHASHNGSKEYYFPWELLLYTCKFGYHSGDSSTLLSCQKTSNITAWGEFDMTCSPACYDPPVVEHANHNGSKKYYLAGEFLAYSCGSGYFWKDSPSFLTCNQTGNTVAWGNLNITCLPKRCGHPGYIEHGSIQGDAFVFNTSVIYTCDIGFKLQGTAIRHCQANQEWSGNAPQCIPKRCGHPGYIAHGSIQGNAFVFNTSVIYTCDIGFKLQGIAIRHCQANQEWSGNSPQCIPKRCGHPGYIAHGSIQGDAFVFNTSVTYTCDIGFKLQGTAIRHCEANQEWSGNSPQCIPVECSNLQAPANGNVVGRGHVFNDSVSFSCKNGFNLSGESTLRCKHDGKWSASPPSCNAKRCEHPGYIEHGRIKGDAFVFNTSVTYTCDRGFRLQGISIRHCQANQEWSGNSPQCIPVECRNLSAPENGDIYGSNHSYNDSVTVSCNDGFTLVGESILRCQHDGTWSSPTPTCNDPSYGLADLIEFFNITPTSIGVSWPAWNEATDVGSGSIMGYQIQIREAGETQFQDISVTFTGLYIFENLKENTEYEFRVVISSDHDIQEEGSPSNIRGQRTLPKHACFNPPVVVNGSHNGSNEYYFPGEVLVYTCDSGYYTGNITTLLKCLQIGDTVAWGTFDMICLPKSCDHPGYIEYGRIEGSIFIPNSSVTYVCDKGFKIQGVDTRHCQANQQWSGDVPQCIPIECRNLSAPENGRINSSSHGYNDSVSFSCNDDFVLVGESTLTCHHDGTWSSPTPTCRGACYNPPVVENASHNGSKEYYLAGELLLYSCNIGYHKGEYMPWLTCQQTNNSVAWGNFNMICSLKSCGHPEGIVHGRIEGKIYSVGSVVTYVCDSGYQMQGNATRYCQTDQEWSGDLPQCSIVTSEACKNSELPLGLMASKDIGSQGFTVHNEWLTVQCVGNLQLSGDNLLQCKHGEWKETASCIGACYDPPVVGNASHNGSKEYYLAGEMLLYTCNTGYHSGGYMPWLTCQQTDNIVAWGNLNMICSLKNCGYPGDMAHGSVDGNVYSFGSVVTYICDSGYQMQGNSTRHCQANQQWSGDSPTCSIVTSEACGNSDLPHGMIASQDHKRQGFTLNKEWLQVQCVGNLQLLGNNSLECEHGKWKETASCIVDIFKVCDNSELPTGLLTYEESKRHRFTLHNGWLRVQCEDHLQLSGLNFLRCRNGAWMETATCTVRSTACDNSDLPEGYIVASTNGRQGFTSNNRVIQCVKRAPFGGGIFQCIEGKWKPIVWWY